MSFFHPGNPENTKFSYNVLTVTFLIGTAALWQLTGAFIPFIVAAAFALFIIWQLYLRFMIGREEDVSEDDKNRIAFHEMLTGDIGRAKNTSERAIAEAQAASRKIAELEERLEKALNSRKDDGA